MTGSGTPGSGTLFVVGTGPGDPDLLTLKAARLIEVAPCIAYFAKCGRPGHARSVAAARIPPGTDEIRLEYPFTTELAVEDPRYSAGIAAFYERSAVLIAGRLTRGLDVVLLCEGDPFFYGSAMYLFDRLAPEFAHRIIPGVTGMSGCWSAARLPFTHGDDTLQVLPATLPLPRLVERLREADAAVIMKVGGNLPKIRTALETTGLLSRAVFVEYGTMARERIRQLERVDPAAEPAPYFSMVLVPGRQDAR